MFKWMKFQSIFFAAAILAGCAQTPPAAAVNHGEDFAPDDQTSATARLLDTQASRGARTDGTLYGCHFDGQYLNSLGMAKLDAMCKDSSDPPIQVWLALPEDDKFNSRRMSVAAYLKDQGLTPEQIQMSRGVNPEVSHPAAQGLKNLQKLDGDSDSSGSGTSTSSLAGPPPAP